MKRSNRSLLVLVAVFVLALHAGIATAQAELESFETRSTAGIRSQGTDVNPEGSGNVLIITGPNPATAERNPATIERNPATIERNPATIERNPTTSGLDS
ncbi:MAG: hypothetical protein JRD03_04660, partial [Deltaproteobacteria bacterium]|nr:hypothetical protein [Deltaproteobacteria bacterium]